MRGVEASTSYNHSHPQLFSRLETSRYNADFNSRVTKEQLLAQLDPTFLQATVVSLIVGGIGIMNIMLVSVTERTREIGIQMSIGARRSDILMEAILLSVVGGLVGVLLGLGSSGLISKLAGWPVLVSPSSVAMSFVFSAAAGMFFGLYPARKASSLHPIDGLRYE